MKTRLSELIFDRDTQKPPSPSRLALAIRDLRLLALGGSVRAAARDKPRLPLFALGVLAGILLCLALGVWQAAHREAAESHRAANDLTNHNQAASR